MGKIRREIPKLTNPHTIKKFWSPRFFIPGLMAKGIPMLMALRRNATPVKASPVIYRLAKCAWWKLRTYITVTVNNNSQRRISNGTETEAKESGAHTWVDPVHPLLCQLQTLWEQTDRLWQ